MKTSAAWLIERAGFERGYGDGRAGISTKHTLALVNRGEATTAELMALARDDRRRRAERVRHRADARARARRPRLVVATSAPPRVMCWGENTYACPPACSPRVAALAFPAARRRRTARSTTTIWPRCRSTTPFQATVDTTEATTQADLFNPNREGVPFSGGDPGAAGLQGRGFGKTVWYDLLPQADGGVELSARRGFAPSSRCTSTRGQPEEPARRLHRPAAATTSSSRSRAGAYTVQIGGVAGAGGPDSTSTYFPDRDEDDEFDQLDKCPTVAGTAFGGCPPELKARAALTFDRRAPAPASPASTSTGCRRAPRSSRSCAGCGSQTITAKRTGRVALSKLVGRTPARRHDRDPVTMRTAGTGDLPLRRHRQSTKYTGARTAAQAAPERCLNVEAGKPEPCSMSLRAGHALRRSRSSPRGTGERAARAPADRDHVRGRPASRRRRAGRGSRRDCDERRSSVRRLGRRRRTCHIPAVDPHIELRRARRRWSSSSSASPPVARGHAAGLPSDDGCDESRRSRSPGTGDVDAGRPRRSAGRSDDRLHRVRSACR